MQNALSNYSAVAQKLPDLILQRRQSSWCGLQSSILKRFKVDRFVVFIQPGLRLAGFFFQAFGPP